MVPKILSVPVLFLCQVNLILLTYTEVDIPVRLEKIVRQIKIT